MSENSQLFRNMEKMHEHKSGKKSSHTHGILETCIICCCCICHIMPVVAAVTPVSPVIYRRENALYDSVAKQFGGGPIRTFPDLQNIIDTMLRKRPCRNPVNETSVFPRCSNKNRCLEPEELFKQAGYLPGMEVLSPMSFSRISVPIISYAANLEVYCSETSIKNQAPCHNVNPPKSSFSCWVETLISNGTNMSRTDLLNLVEKLDSDPKTQRSERHTEKETLIHAIYEFLLIPQSADIPPDQVPLLTTFILSRILEGRIEEKKHVDPPSPSVFIESLFDLKELEDIAMKLKIGNFSVNGHHNHHHGDDHDDDHADHKQHSLANHTDNQNSSDSRIKRDVLSAEKPANETCWSLDALKKAYLVDKDRLNQQEFERLCPALIQQAFSGVCEVVDLAPIRSEHPPNSHIYGYGTVSVIVISLLSILGIFFFPLLKREIYEYALQGFIALGVGTLTGDALLHLIPEGFGVHKHDDHDDGHGHAGEEPEDRTILWRALACCAAIYGFFLWEICLHSFIHHRNRHGKKDSRGHQHTDHDHDHSHIPDPAAFLQARSKPEDAVIEMSKEVEKDGSDKDVVQKPKTDTLWGLSPLAWMILLGDSLHNFGDGLTIAAAFSLDVNTGISTSIAIFCHEVPHELGDFAILLGTGMSFRKAMVLNFVTALTCLLGFYIGVPIAKQESARQWIFIVAAGMFLYVALADMLPELKNGKKNVTTFIVQNIGMLAGVGIMILMGVYEHAIKI